jgi:hypothetical protein
MTMNRQRLMLGVVAILGVCSAAAVLAVSFQLVPVTSSDVREAQWRNSTLTWSLNPALPNSNVFSSSGVVANEGALTAAVSAAFNTWHSATYNSLQVNTLSFTQGTDSALTTPAVDCQNVVGFADTTDFPLSTGTIAFAHLTYVLTPTPGSGNFTYGNAAPVTCNPPVALTCPYEVCIADADIEFNPHYQFTTYSPTPAGKFDLQAVSTHEIGHLLGLDHSGLANAVMFPYGDSNGAIPLQALAVDDMIGSVVLYGSNAIQSVASDISGTVKIDGSAAFAAHVMAIDATTGNIITDTLTRPDGSYKMPIVSGTYYVLVQPLGADTNHGPYTLGNFTGFECGFASSFSTCSGAPTNPMNYTGKFF